TAEWSSASCRSGGCRRKNWYLVRGIAMQFSLLSFWMPQNRFLGFAGPLIVFGPLRQFRAGAVYMPFAQSTLPPRPGSSLTMRLEMVHEAVNHEIQSQMLGLAIRQGQAPLLVSGEQPIPDGREPGVGVSPEADHLVLPISVHGASRCRTTKRACPIMDRPFG